MLPSLLRGCPWGLFPGREKELLSFGLRSGRAMAVPPDLARSRLRSKIEEAPLLASAEPYPLCVRGRSKAALKGLSVPLLAGSTVTVLLHLGWK